MLFRPARSIRAKLALLIAASVGAAVALSFGVSSYRELARFGEAKRSEIEATANVLAASVADAVARGDRPLAMRALNAIGRIPGVRFAEIRGVDDRVFAEAGAGVALTSRRSAASTPRGTAPDDAIPSVFAMLTQGSFFVTAEVVKGGIDLGTLGLLVDTSELAERLKQALFAAAISAMAATLIGLLIASRLQLAITRPLGDLAQNMNRVRQTNDFTQRAERRSDDETGQLVDAFNDMLDQIGSRDTALEEHRAGLERTVIARTRELADARDAAESANRAKSDFLATMSHEIRTPMNGMLVMAELLAGADLPARQQRYAETIARSGQTLLTIINDILDISKIEAGKLQLEQGRVVVATLVEDVLGLFFERASSKNLDLAASIAADVPDAIEGDPVRLSQILSNLVNNALKFTETGHVLLSVERQGDALVGRAALQFCIEDTGIGIPADKVGHIFEAFSQADQSTTRRFGGTGLGLSICQRLIDAMGGRIWVESEPGRGSRFMFSIDAPILEEQPPRPSATTRTAIVTIEPIATRQVLAETLAAAGYDVVASSLDADIVFADADLIEANGICRKEAGPRIVCVAGLGDSRVDRFLNAGSIDCVLQRPVSSNRIREILGASETGTLASLVEGRRAGPVVDLPKLSNLDVLVADDSPVNREVISEALGRLDARSTTVEDGVRVVAAFKQGGFDIVLMDCSMPEMDGFAATRAIRAYEAERGLARTPVIALTAHVAGSAADSWRDAGMDDYLTKPFTIRGLADCLARWRPLEAVMAQRDTAQASATPAAPLSPGPESDDPLDAATLQSLRAISGGNDGMLDKIFGLFRAHAPTRLAALKDALAQSDLPRAASEAHALKSPSLNIGALRLGALCATLEERARRGDASILADDNAAAIEIELSAVMSAIGQARPREFRAAS